MVTDKGASMKPAGQTQEPVDDQGTTQAEAARILSNLRERGFASSSEELGLALGRSARQVEAWCEGLETIDDDALAKARGIAETRGLDI